jgi:cell shape-determining protein MreC
VKQNKKDTPRRAPLLRFRTVLFLFVCFLVGVVVIVSTVGGRFGLFHQFTLETIGNAQSILTSVSSSIQTVWGGYVDLVDVRRDNERLRALIDAKDEELARTGRHTEPTCDCRKSSSFVKTVNFRRSPHVLSVRILPCGFRPS